MTTKAIENTIKLSADNNNGGNGGSGGGDENDAAITLTVNPFYRNNDAGE